MVPLLALEVLLGAILIDRLIGDPKVAFHPVALLGRVIARWAKPGVWSPTSARAVGAGLWIATVLLFVVPFLFVEVFASWYILLILGPILLKFTFAWRALEEHCQAAVAVVSRDLTQARECVGMIVSRETGSLSSEQVRSAAYESTAENLVDSIIAPLFYFGLFGLPGAALYRAANTMDAMVGYKDWRERLGWCAARADDILSYFPARIAGALLLVWFICRGRAREAWRVYLRDGSLRPGPNGGIPIALLAGGVGVRFEKPGVYMIGDPIRSLEEAGYEVIAAVQGVSLLFVCLLAASLFLLQILVQT